jgi:ATP phosphoribosyltransferase regulatory subunit
MNRLRYTPQGMQDDLPGACRLIRSLEEKAAAVFTQWGYEEIAPAIVEYMEVFTNRVSAFPQEAMFKFCDQQGRLLALRPDITTAAARVAATRLREEEILRLSYIGPAFSFSGEDHVGGLREYTQMGVELMGESAPDADAEVIALAITALKEIGLEDFQVDIGQVNFFIGLAEDAGLTGEAIEQLRQAVEQKNSLAIEMLLKQAHVEGKTRARIEQLPMLYGGREVLETARKYSSNPRCLQAVENIERILGILEEYGLSDYLSIDLGMVQSIGYYTGIIFRGICELMGAPILTGGRYDRLVGEFGRDMPATGFAMNVKPLLTALERRGKVKPSRAVDALVGYEPGARRQALDWMAQLREKGLRVRQSLDGLEQLKAMGERLPNVQIYWVQQAAITTLLTPKEAGDEQ